MEASVGIVPCHTYCPSLRGVSILQPTSSRNSSSDLEFSMQFALKKWEATLCGLALPTDCTAVELVRYMPAVPGLIPCSFTSRILGC